MTEKHHPNFVHYLLLIGGIILIATNLRPAITSVGPLLGTLRTERHRSYGLAGLLTTLPLLAFAAFSMLAPKLSRRFGNALVIFAGLLTLIIGVLMRSISSIATLFIGTFVLGIAIAICNVLLPSVIKRQFPGRVGLMTGIYATWMGIFAALGSGISVPLAERLGLGWKGALAFWALWAAVAAIVWIPQLRNRQKPDGAREVNVRLSGLWRSPLAWQVTLFMGLQSLIFYVSISWLPELLDQRGLSISAAGWIVSFMQFVGLPGTFLIPVLADRTPSQRWLVIITCAFYVVGLSGLLFSTAWPVLWIALLGLGQGSSISLSYAFLGLRARNSGQAAELSGMAQSVGYILAAVGPVLIGYLHDMTHDWTLPLGFLIVITFVMLLAGLGAGRDAYVTPNVER